jgi:hypothetical protein
VRDLTIAVRPSPETMRALGQARWPSLKRFTLDLLGYIGARGPSEEAEDDSAAARAAPPTDALDALLRSLEGAKTLEHLGLRTNDWRGDDLAERLAASPLRERLTSLDLSRTGLTDRAAQNLFLSKAIAFTRLRTLDLSGNRLGRETCNKLGLAFGNAVALDGQNTYEDVDDVDFDLENDAS